MFCPYSRLAITLGLHPREGGPIPSEGTKGENMGKERRLMLADKLEKLQERMKKVGISIADGDSSDLERWIDNANATLDCMEDCGVLTLSQKRNQSFKG